jgi:hypothetical protein
MVKAFTPGSAADRASISRALKLRAIIKAKGAKEKSYKKKYADAAKAAYGDCNAPPPDGYELIKCTKTLKFYRNKMNPTEVILGVRGTADGRDIAADAALSVGLLGLSSRYKDDKVAVTEFLRENPGVKLATAGHSLGGAVARQLTRDFPESIVGGEGFNSAIGLDELIRKGRLDKGKQTRYTTRSDPLRLLSKPFLKEGQQATVVDNTVTADILGAHKMANFDATGAGV